MEDPHGPQTQVHEGTRAIKVSMNCTNPGPAYLRDPESARTICLDMMNARTMFDTCCGTNVKYSPVIGMPAAVY